MKKAYFQYYETFEVILGKIKDAEQREYMRRVIIEYGLHGTEPENLTELQDMAFTMARDLIDQQTHRREVNAVNRSKKQEPVAEETEQDTQPEAKPEEKQPAEEKAELKKFVKPTVEEIAAYCKEKHYPIDPQAFWNYYESNGWKIGGRAAMKNWRAAVQTWSARDRPKAGTLWAAGSADADTAQYEDLF